jgi:hypothetical protein
MRAIIASQKARRDARLARILHYAKTLVRDDNLWTE